MDLFVSGSCGAGTVLAGARNPARTGLSVVDLSRGSFFDASALVGLACFVEGQLEAGLRVVVVPPGNPQVGRYLARMRLGQVLDDLDVPHSLPQVNEYSINHLLELQRFDGASGADALANLAHRMVHPISARAAQALTSGLGEAGENVCEHSGRRSGYAAAQKYPRDGRFVFSVGDSGLGMLATSPDQRSFTHSQAIEAAVTAGVTSTPDTARGNGLPDVASEVISLGGRLDIISGDAQVVVSSRGTRPTLSSLTEFQGTLVRGEVHVERP